MEPLTNEYLIKLVDKSNIERIKKSEEEYQLNKDTYKLYWRKFFHDKDLRPIKDIYDDAVKFANSTYPVSEWNISIFGHYDVIDLMSPFQKISFSYKTEHIIRASKEVLNELYGDILMKYFPTAEFDIISAGYSSAVFRPVLTFKLMRAFLL